MNKLTLMFGILVLLSVSPSAIAQNNGVAFGPMPVISVKALVPINLDLTTLLANPGTPPYIFSSPDLPAGLYIRGNFLVGSLPSGQAGTYSFHFSVEDSAQTADLNHPVTLILQDRSLVSRTNEHYFCSWTSSGGKDIEVTLNTETREMKILVLKEFPVTETSPALLGLEVTGIATYAKEPEHNREVYMLPGWNIHQKGIVLWKQNAGKHISLQGLSGYEPDFTSCK